MDFFCIRLENKAAISWLWLNRPELHNAFNAGMIAELTQAFRQLSEDPECRAVVLAAEGKSFCAGADLNWMQSMANYTFEENVADASALFTMLEAIRNCQKPVIGRIHGAAFGGGVGLTAACDMTVALESARFCLSEVKLGLLPAVISPFVLEKIPLAQARRYFLTAERFSAQVAQQMGLVSQVVATPAELDTQIAEWVNLLLANGPEALAVCKTLMSEVSAANDWSAQQTLTTRLIAERRISAEGQEGMHAFLQKRPAAWQNPVAVS